MIQRIQTLYLLLASLCLGGTFLLPLAKYTDGVSEYTLRAYALSGDGGVQPTIYMGILLALSALLPLVTIFLFKRRGLQMRLCVAELIMLAGSAVMMGVYCWLCYSAASELPQGKAFLSAGLLLPLPALLFVILALRAIFRDEMLIRSLNRIR